MESKRTNLTRLLVVDNDESFNNKLSQVLVTGENRGFIKDGLGRLAEKLFDRPSVDNVSPEYDISFCQDSAAALREVFSSLSNSNRFAIILFDIDVMSAGDVSSTVADIRKIDPMVNILIMTSGDDLETIDISLKPRPGDRLFYIEKPSIPREIKLLVLLLTAKWLTEDQLVKENLKLETENVSLSESLSTRSSELQDLRIELDSVREDNIAKNKDIAELSGKLSEKSVAMKVVLKNIANEGPGRDKKVLQAMARETDEKITVNLHQLSEPYLNKLAMTPLNDEQQQYLDILRHNLREIANPAMQRLSSMTYGLSPAELKVANLIKQGKSTKAIAKVLNLSVRTIDFHRDKIRKKLRINDRKTTLKVILDSFNERNF